MTANEASAGISFLSDVECIAAAKFADDAKDDDDRLFAGAYL